MEKIKNTVKIIGGGVIMFMLLLIIITIWFGDSIIINKLFLTLFVIGVVCFIVDKSLTTPNK